MFYQLAESTAQLFIKFENKPMKYNSLTLLVVLIVLIAFLTALNLLLPQGEFANLSAPDQLPPSKPVTALASALLILVVYGGLGVLGRHLALKLGFPDLLDPTVTDRVRFKLPALVGIVIGILFIPLDHLFATFHGMGPLPHPPFPTSLVASIVAGIGEELMFRLFFISFWVWLISRILLKSRAHETVFWIVAVLSALAFAAGHLPSVMVIVGAESISALPSTLIAEVFLLNTMVSLPAAYYLRRAGFLAAVSIHFWTDVVWHVIWGLL